MIRLGIPLAALARRAQRHPAAERERAAFLVPALSSPFAVPFQRRREIRPAREGDTIIPAPRPRHRAMP